MKKRSDFRKCVQTKIFHSEHSELTHSNRRSQNIPRPTQLLASGATEVRQRHWDARWSLRWVAPQNLAPLLRKLKSHWKRDCLFQSLRNTDDVFRAMNPLESQLQRSENRVSLRGARCSSKFSRTKVPYLQNVWKALLSLEGHGRQNNASKNGTYQPTPSRNSLWLLSTPSKIH